MTLQNRKWIVVGAIALTLAMANAAPLVCWFERMGIISLADWISRRFITGTAIAVVAALLWLLVDRSPARVNDSRNRCRVCDHPVFAGGRYCPHCGSRA